MLRRMSFEDDTQLIGAYHGRFTDFLQTPPYSSLEQLSVIYLHILSAPASLDCLKIPFEFNIPHLS